MPTPDMTEPPAVSGAAETCAPRPGRALLWLVIAIIAVYAAGLNPYWRFQRDSSIYLGLARSLIETGRYRFDYEEHTMYPPGLPAILAGVGLVFGLPDRIGAGFLAVNVLMLAFGLGSIGIVWMVFRELRLPDSVRLPAVLLFASSRTLYYYSQHIMTDVPFTFFALAAVYAGLKMLHSDGKRSLLWALVAGVLVAVASSIRAAGPVLAAALILGVWLRKGSLRQSWANAGRTALICVLLVALLGLWAARNARVGSPEAAGYFRGRVSTRVAVRTVRVVVGRTGESLAGLADAVSGTHAGPVLGAILVALALAGILRAVRSGEVAFTAYGVLSALVVMAGGWALGRRYLLPALPAVFYWLVLGAGVIAGPLGRLGSFWTPRRLKALGWACLGILLAVNVARIGKLIAENRAPSFYAKWDEGRGADYAAVTDWLRQHAPPGSGVFGYEGTTLHYFTGLPSFSPPRGAEGVRPNWLLRQLREQRIRYIVQDERKAQSTGAVGWLRDGFPEAFQVVFETGKVDVLECVPLQLGHPGPLQPLADDGSLARAMPVGRLRPRQR